MVCGRRFVSFRNHNQKHSASTGGILLEMSYQLCLNCFNIKGNFKVCPYCGYVEGAQQKAAFQLRQGTILQDRYIIGEALGYGGFGITYRAYDTRLSIVVAVKEFYPASLVNRAEGESRVGIFSGDKAVEYQKLLGRFIEEARNMALFEKEQDVVNVFSHFEANGTAYIIMEYVEGTLLKKYIKENGKMPEKQACTCICAILTALQKIHDKGIIHKDVSPDNIFLLPSDQIKIFDFGAAKLQEDDGEKNLSVVVKAGYAPPEQYRSKGKQDHRVDIYAAGAVFYQLLTGERPMESLDRSMKDLLQLPSKKGIPVSPHVEAAVMKALSLNPKDRFGSAREFREAIQTPETQRRRWRPW